MCVYKQCNYFGIAVVDITTGEFSATRINYGNTKAKLIDEIAKYNPSEILVNNEVICDSELLDIIKNKLNIYISAFSDEYFTNVNARNKISSLIPDCEIIDNEFDLSVNASGALLEYLEQTQKSSLSHIQTIKSYDIEKYMVLDLSTRRNLELTETIRDKSRKGTLLWVLDKTVTSMGGRMLRKWMEQPLINVHDINDRLNAVSEFKDKFMLRMEIRELLKNVYDIERLIGKVVLGSANCRDLIALRNSLAQLPQITNIMKECEAPLNKNIFNSIDTLEDVHKLIDDTIEEEPPVSVKEGGIIKKGYSEEVDNLRRAATEGKSWIASIEASEREKTGIKNLKIGFNKVFGYYIEVTKSYYDLVPETYIRKQTLANCERYITQELKEIEETILGAEEKVVKVEYEIFVDIRNRVAQQVDRIKKTAVCIAQIDVLSSFAEVADRESYTMPEVSNDEIIEIKDGRHPVVEKTMGQNSFVPNDTLLDMSENRLAIITGPNMAGKSTYMRQTALIVLMAQIGSFVPASSAKIGITDRIFTRVGASDDLASGQSTFMVEMTEVANILANATPRSLLILDEIGRGTSTFDGLSIAWSVIEYIASKENIGCRTLFATHYHELTELEGKLTGIKNYCITVKEEGDDIIFLRKIIRGGADGSYGIQVAKLAGVPQPVIDRAKEILKILEEEDISKKEAKIRKTSTVIEGQIDMFAVNSLTKSMSEIIDELKSIEITNLTPLDAMNILYRLQKKARSLG